ITTPPPTAYGLFPYTTLFRSERVLPLAEDLGRVIVRYLQHARPVSSHRSLLIRHRAPFSPLSSYTISWIAGRRLKQAGVTAARLDREHTSELQSRSDLVCRLL